MGEASELKGDDLPVNFHGNLLSARNDHQLKDVLLRQVKRSKRPTVISYGATWCHACKQMLPTFCNMSNEYPKALFVHVDIDECPEETLDIRYTPSFQFFRDGEKVDEFYGAGPQRLRDRVWLHS